ncbi:hypothetical protein VIGAN_11103700, partial [Vigna angularis var. angularis]
MMIDIAQILIPLSTIFQFTLISHQIHNPMRTQVPLFNTEHPQQQTTTTILLQILQPDVASTLPLSLFLFISISVNTPVSTSIVSSFFLLCVGGASFMMVEV